MSNTVPISEQVEVTPQKCRMVTELIMELYPNVRLYGNGVTYESINLGSYDGPFLTKEEFQTKLQERIDGEDLRILRENRNTLLDQTDKFATTDYPHADDATRQSWLSYRQALRDLTTTTDPSNPTWPTRPDGKPTTVSVVRQVEPITPNVPPTLEVVPLVPHYNVSV